MTAQKGTVAAGSTLAQINKVVAQTEDTVGPLTGIGNDGTSTVLTFDSDPPAPATNARITPDVNGRSSAPAGSSVVCSGTIFISGSLTPSTAYRP